MQCSHPRCSHFKFSKYHGRGNDFILVDDRSELFNKSKKYIFNLCHRNLGIGADGIVLLQNSVKADIRMRIFNADGTEGKCCGNALFCLLCFVKDQNIFKVQSVSIETEDKIVFAKKEGDLFSINMGQPKNLILDHWIDIEGKKLRVHLLNTGVEHAVVFVDDVEKICVNTLGKKIRYHKDFLPMGVNVNFVHRKNNDILVRTYEKGVENETLSCGTGGCAVVVVLSKLYGYSSNKISFKGGELTISWLKDGLFMEGKAKRVFLGSY